MVLSRRVYDTTELIYLQLSSSGSRVFRDGEKLTEVLFNVSPRNSQRSYLKGLDKECEWELSQGYAKYNLSSHPCQCPTDPP